MKLTNIKPSFGSNGSIKDYAVNTSKNIVYANRQEYPKVADQTYIDVTIEILDGDNQGLEFKIENLSTSLYQAKNGKKSQFWIFLSRIGVKEEIIISQSEKEAITINLMHTKGKTIENIYFAKKDNRPWVDLRDPTFIEKKEEKKETNTKSVEDVFGDDSEDDGGLFD